jgi:hypothetical protein
MVRGVVETCRKFETDATPIFRKTGKIQMAMHQAVRAKFAELDPNSLEWFFDGGMVTLCKHLNLITPLSTVQFITCSLEALATPNGSEKTQTYRRCTIEKVCKVVKLGCPDCRREAAI